MKSLSPLYGIITAAMLIAPPVTVWAAIRPSIRRAETGLSIGAGVLFQGDTECYQGQFLDSNQGALWTSTVGLQRLSGRNAGLYWRVRLTVAGGRSGNTGNQALGLPGASGIADRATDLAIRLGIGLNRLWPQPRDSVFIPYLSVGALEWQRSGSGDNWVAGPETYSALRTGLGLRYDYALTPRLVLSLQGAAGYAFAAHISARGPISLAAARGATNDGWVSAAVGPQPYTMFQAGVTCLAARRWHVTLAVRRTLWSYRASNPLPVTGAVPGGTYAIPGAHVTQTAVDLEFATVF